MPCYEKEMIVAEVGHNWCGDMCLAHELIALAKVNDADLVKFALFDSSVNFDENQIDSLTKEQAFELFNYGKEIGIEVFFSVYDVERVKWCEEMGVKRYKIATSQNCNYRLKDAVGATNKEVIISSQYVPAFVSTRARVLLLCCIPHYPTELKELKFANIDFTSFHGISDHTIGLDAAKIALARGAKIIEKHFAIDHETGVDAPWSMTPDDLKELKRFEQAVNEAL